MKREKPRLNGVTEIAWLPHGDPMPEGWKFVDEMISHHSNYAYLIVRIDSGRRDE